MKRIALFFLFLLFPPSPFLFAAAAGPGPAAAPPVDGEKLTPFWTNLNSGVSYSGGGGGSSGTLGPNSLIADIIYTESFMMHVLFTSENLLADADRIDAMTERQWMDNYRQFIQTAALVSDFTVYRNEQTRVAAFLASLQIALPYLDELKIGNVHGKTMEALDYVERTVVPAAELNNLLFQNVPRLDSSNFVSPHKKQPPKDFVGGKLIDLYKFIKTTKYSLRFSSEANFIFMGALQSIYQHIGVAVTQKLTQMDARRKDIFQRWKIDFRERTHAPPDPDKTVK